MKKLEVRLTIAPGHERCVGVLAESDRRIYFEYDAEFLKSPLWLSPFKLPPEPGLHEHRDRSFGPLFGLFDDSLPDGWGLLLMDRLFVRQGLAPEVVSPLDRLAYLGSRTMGALTYHPPAHPENVDRQLLDLRVMALESYRVLEGKSDHILSQLLSAGGSPGGARPKVLVGLQGDKMISGEDMLPENYAPWIVKFHTRREATEEGRVEYAYAQMAMAAGVTMQPTRLFETSEGERYFGVERFDRQGNRRRHIHSFGNLIHANFRIPGCDYEQLLKVTRILTKNHADVVAAFRLMVFNVLAHNRDDHVKNFAFMMDVDGCWALAPAYDLTFAQGPGGEHTMTVSGEGREPGRKHILGLAEKAGMSISKANNVLEEVSGVVAEWKRFAREAGVKRGTSEKIDKAIKQCLGRL
jgi:serine/threonine-protein kinase HipA